MDILETLLSAATGHGLDLVPSVNVGRLGITWLTLDIDNAVSQTTFNILVQSVSRKFSVVLKLHIHPKFNQSESFLL